jgi:hypothetical protein
VPQRRARRWLGECILSPPGRLCSGSPAFAQKLRPGRQTRRPCCPALQYSITPPPHSPFPMNPNRNGKIACLPETIRIELNHRLHAGERGQTLITWLNNLPLVQQVIKMRFHGKPITAANLSEWRNGGYREWRLENEPKPKPRPEWQARQRQWQVQPCQQQQAQHSPEPQAAAEATDDKTLEDSEEVTDPAEVSDRLAVRLGLELSQFAETWLAGARNPRERWRRLRELLSALAQLRRGDHRAANLDITQDRWQAEVDEHEADLEKKHL